MQELDCNQERFAGNKDLQKKLGPSQPTIQPWLASQEWQHPFPTNSVLCHFSSFSQHQHEEEPGNIKKNKQSTKHRKNILELCKQYISGYLTSAK